MSGFYDAAFQHAQEPADFPDLFTHSIDDDTLLAEAPSDYEAAAAQIAGDELGEEGEPREATKRRRPSRPDHVKHRRTRNGCYTCRSRRVKCDEQRPTCERCSKGKRECTYPEPRPNPRSSTAGKKDRLEQTADNSRSPSIEDEDVEIGPHASSEGQARPKIERTQSGSSSSQAQRRASSGYFGNVGTHGRQYNEQSKFENSLSPSSENSSAPTSAGLEQPQKFSSISTSASQDTASWNNLPGDLQYYLDYHQRNLTHNYYFFKHETDRFLPTILIEQALQYEPLLYAVVGFAAFHGTVKRPNGKIQDFIGYYDKSVSLLRKSLACGQTYTHATLLTTLQLATFEEYLGDYVSLLVHQQAAYRMLLELYSPETIMASELGRQAIAWYARFDLTSGLMSENETVLGREWFLCTERYYQDLTWRYPLNIDYKIEYAASLHRTLCSDLAVLFSKLARGTMTPELRRESDRCKEQLENWRDTLDPTFKDEQYLVKNFPGKHRDPADIVDPYVSIWREPLFTFNFMLLDWYSMSILFKFKISSTMLQPPPPDLKGLALEACRMFETIEYWPASPAGSVLKAQSSLGIASLFLPKDERHTMWCRRKLAKVESLGHIYPPAFRQRMASIWAIPDINHWWLPNEKGCPAVVRSIRFCMENRLPQAASQSRSEDQRNIKGLFSKLTLDKDAGATMIDEDLTAAQLSADATRKNSNAGPVGIYAGQSEAEAESEDSLLEQSRERFRQVIQGKSEGAG